MPGILEGPQEGREGVMAEEWDVVYPIPPVDREISK